MENAVDFHSGVPVYMLWAMPDDTPVAMLEILGSEIIERLRKKGITTFGDVRRALAPE